jgi:GDPmannose 4,6-dehydratase
MHLILNYESPRDWVVSTGETKSVRDLCEYTFTQLGMNYKDYVIQDEKYFRKEEVNYLRGDSTEIRETLGWNPKYTFNSMIDEMIDFWESNLK